MQALYYRLLRKVVLVPDNAQVSYGSKLSITVGALAMQVEGITAMELLAKVAPDLVEVLTETEYVRAQVFFRKGNHFIAIPLSSCITEFHHMNEG